MMKDTDKLQPFDAPEDEDATARLLRAAGPRPEIPADRAARVRREVYRHWQTTSRRRTLWRRASVAAVLCAAAAAVVLAVRISAPHDDVTPAGEVVATVDRVEGEARLLPTTGARQASSTLSAKDTVRAGEWLEMGPTARAALRLSDGTWVRLDIGSRAGLVSSKVIELTRGALYFDTGHDAGGLEVRTPLGTVHDIGTQFEIRVSDSSLRLRVRSGMVEVRRNGQSIPARSGTELTLAAEGTVSRSVSAHGPEWEWTSSLAPAFEIEGRPLAAFLEHLCHEHGWTLRYADADLARDASKIVLHGSVNGLQGEESLRVALTTSGFVHRFRDGELFVSR